MRYYIFNIEQKLFVLSRGGPSMRGTRGGGQADPRRHMPMEGFFPNQQAVQRASDGNRSFYNSAYNQNYGDNLDSYIDNSDNENFLDRETFMRDYKFFQENYNSNANDSFGLPPRLGARINND